MESNDLIRIWEVRGVERLVSHIDDSVWIRTPGRAKKHADCGKYQCQ